MKEFFNNLYTKTAEDFFELIKQNLKNNKKSFVITANPETFMTANNNETLSNALLDKNTLVVADGIGIIKGAKMLKANCSSSPIAGVELCSKLFEYCNDLNKSIYLFGAKDDVVNKLVEVIKSNYPNAIVCGHENGYVADKQKTFDEIANLKPDVVLVALGIPNQELLIYNNLNKFDKGIFVGVGGSFDVLSGTKKRAPKLFRKLHLEWLYRILREPKRFKRFFKNNVSYIFKIKKER